MVPSRRLRGTTLPVSPRAELHPPRLPALVSTLPISPRLGAPGLHPPRLFPAPGSTLPVSPPRRFGTRPLGLLLVLNPSVSDSEPLPLRRSWSFCPLQEGPFPSHSWFHAWLLSWYPSRSVAVPQTLSSPGLSASALFDFPCFPPRSPGLASPTFAPYHGPRRPQFLSLNPLLSHLQLSHPTPCPNTPLFSYPHSKHPGLLGSDPLGPHLTSGQPCGSPRAHDSRRRRREDRE